MRDSSPNDDSGSQFLVICIPLRGAKYRAKGTKELVNWINASTFEIKLISRALGIIQALLKQKKIDYYLITLSSKLVLISYCCFEEFGKEIHKMR